MLDSWHRLEKVIKWTGLSVNSFALNIGLKRSENLYQIKKGNNNISRDLAELITLKYPTISRGWLLAGEGVMFIEEGRNPYFANDRKSIGVPYYGIDAVTVIKELETLEEPHSRINIEWFNHCDVAALALGTAMSPEMPPGAVVFMKKVTLGTVIPGEPYLIIAEHFNGIRIVRVTENPEEFLLIPRNMQDYDPIILPKELITNIYAIRGIIIKKNI